MPLKANAKSGVDGPDAAGELRMLPTHRKQRVRRIFFIFPKALCTMRR
jgi:hypothetical protein